MRLFILIFLFMGGCGSAQLISMRLRPVKQGTVRVQWSGPIWKDMAFDKARDVMRGFCAPLRAQVVGSDQSSQVAGVYADPMIRGAYQYDYQETPLIHFECVKRELAVDEPVQASPE